MPMRSARTGSVLLEFILVLPVYFVFIGGTFAVGEILVRALHVTWAERAVATNYGSDFVDATKASVQARLFPFDAYEYDDEDGLTHFADRCTFEGNALRAEEGYQGAWTWQTAAKATDEHNRTPWTRGWLFSAANWLDAMTEPENASKKSKDVIGKTAKEIGSFVSIVSGERKSRKYGYYTLVRTDLGRSGRRDWAAKNLTEVDQLPVLHAEWYANVHGEPFADSDPRQLDRAAQDADELPETPGRDDYQRFPSFMLWSQ